MAKHALNVTRAENFADWYQEVVKGADMAENSGVRGCMIIKPWGFAIWERVQRLLDDDIKKTGHENVYFPLFIPLELFKKEAEHVNGFAKEMAVVTHHRLEMKNGELTPAGELEHPLVVRPTSETVICEAFADWIKSYRDLPVKINQWANIVRWEMRTRLFLRTSEFLWQEGHTAHETKEEAEAETLQMLEVYRTLVEDKMCIPLICGRKSPGERFPGAVDTYTIEAMMQDGKALQSGTSHYLGHTFAKAANIRFQDKNGDMQFVHTTSWGVSTRLIGGLIMTHADDDGLRLPPQIAPQQIIVCPILKDTPADIHVMEACKNLKTRLEQQHFAGESVRVRLDVPKGDARGQRWAWVRKGAPIVCELGERDLKDGVVAVSLRSDVHGKKITMPLDDLVQQTPALLRAFEAQLKQEAEVYRTANTTRNITTPEAFRAYFAQEKTGFVIAKWSGDAASEDSLKELGVTIRCLPLQQSGTSGTCVLTGKPATLDAVFARSY